MTLQRRATLKPLLALLALPAVPLHSLAQHAAGLYDPQPPADSAYVRVIVLSAAAPVEVWLNDKARIRQLAVAQPSDYMVLGAGRHNLTLKSGGKSVVVPVEVVAGRSLTLAIAQLSTEVKPLILEDKPNTNKLKAIVMAYHLASKGGPLDILTADGGTKVFSSLAPGSSASLAVNPVTIDFIVTRAGDKTALARAGLSMSQGGTYSLVLTSADGAALAAAGYANKVERYTGK